jgi:hypothetical protein
MYYTTINAFASWYFLNRWQPVTDDEVEWVSKPAKKSCN